MKRFETPTKSYKELQKDIWNKEKNTKKLEKGYKITNNKN